MPLNRKRLLRILVLACVVVAASLVGLACTEAPPPPGPDIEAEAKLLFETKCSACHELERPMSKRFTEQGWRNTVNRMRGTYNAPISEAEAEKIIKHLIKNYGQ